MSSRRPKKKGAGKVTRGATRTKKKAAKKRTTKKRTKRKVTKRTAAKKKAVKKKAVKKKAVKKKAAKKKAAKKKAAKKKGVKRGSGGRTAGKTRAKRTRPASKKAPSSSALGKLQPELEKALSRLLGRVRRKLDKLPRSPQLKLLEVEAGDFTYTLNRLRPPPGDNLTHRQKQIARLVSQGLSNKGIASKLDISPATVAAHLRTIFTKLKVKTRTALAKHALAYYG